MLNSNNQPTREPTKLSEEPGFLIFDLRGTMAVEIPAMPGLLGFIRVDGDRETVVKILMLDDLAKGFLDNIRHAGGADRVAYIVFPATGNFDKRTASMEARLNFFAQLTAKYSSPKNSRPEFSP